MNLRLKRREKRWEHVDAQRIINVRGGPRLLVGFMVRESFPLKRSRKCGRRWVAVWVVKRDSGWLVKYDRNHNPSFPDWRHVGAPSRSGVCGVYLTEDEAIAAAVQWWGTRCCHLAEKRASGVDDILDKVSNNEL